MLHYSFTRCFYRNMLCVGLLLIGLTSCGSVDTRPYATQLASQQMLLVQSHARLQAKTIQRLMLETYQSSVLLASAVRDHARDKTVVMTVERGKTVAVRLPVATSRIILQKWAFNRLHHASATMNTALAYAIRQARARAIAYDPSQIAGYVAYVVQPGDTLEQIAARGGSHPDVIRVYNQLQGLPTEGRPLIIPRLVGATSELPLTPMLIRYGDTNQLWINLSFDSEAKGDWLWTMLDTLREQQVHVTFFVTGGWASINPDVMRQIAADGHEFGNHSYSHPNFVTLSSGQIAAELAETERIVHELTGKTTRPFFRPPYGKFDSRVLYEVIAQGYLPIHWSLDSQDALGEAKSADYLLERVTGFIPPEQLPGTLVLAHCCSPRDGFAGALPRIIQRLNEMGFEIRPLRDMLGVQ